MTTSDTKHMLGEFIRAHRERQSIPVRSATRRRTPGMRREELAEAAGVSATWITWLEQGRNVTASAGALARLADALHLSSAERASLFDLSGKRDPARPDAAHNELLPGLLALPGHMTVPAYLLDHNWTARAWNKQAEQLFPGWLDAQAEERNLLKFVFLNDSARTLIADWPERAQRLVAEFHADFIRRPAEAGLQTLVEVLSSQSKVFAQYWNEQAVLHREGGARSFHHPTLGQLHFLQTTLLVASQQECKLVCLAPVT